MRRLTRRTGMTSLVAALVASLTFVSPVRGDTISTQVIRGLTVPVGFGATVFAETGAFLPTSLTFGPDGRLYVAAITANLSGEGEGFAEGKILAFEDLGGIGGAPQEVASGLSATLGVAFGPDGTMYASDNTNPFAEGQRGAVVAFTDGDGDGTFEQRRTLLKNIPNGRHQTNGLAIGADGMLYVANGNATDDGVECGPALTPGGSEDCTSGEVEVKPWSGSIIRVDPAWEEVDLLEDVVVDDNDVADEYLDDEQVLVAEGFRNIYDLDFWPGDPTLLYTWMNGSDNPSSSEPLYRTDIDDTRVVGADPDGTPVEGPVVDDMGFPSCLYDPHTNAFPLPEFGHDHPGIFTPEDNPNPRVIEQFGPCPRNTVVRPIEFTTEGHEGTSGLAFERGDDFPERYDGDLFLVQWGSLWNLSGAQVTGHKIMHIDIGPDGRVERRREFMTSPLPIDVTFGPDGAMYVADMAGVIYRIEHLTDTPDPVEITMTNGQFVPQVVAVPERTTIRWVNEDSAAHTVTAVQAVTPEGVPEEPALRPGSEIDSDGDIPPGGSHEYAFGDQSGTWVYRSAGGEAMQGAIVVVPHGR